MNNTLNVCLGHLPFPAAYQHHIDLMIAPRLIAGPTRLALVEDSRHGPNGSALSEYVQLLWLDEHLDEVAADCEFVRIFHYRRFVATTPPGVGTTAANLPWATTIQPSELAFFDAAFDRRSHTEVYNTPVQLANGMLGQYAEAHVLEDILHFTDFIGQQGMMTAREAAEFLRQPALIPSCNIGVFRRDTFHLIFNILRSAAEFVHSPYFVNREGYQRRSVGFLLERLNSYLILKVLQADPQRGTFGHNMVISDSAVVTHTV